MGRPTKCTPELTEAICERIRNGVRDEVAAGAEGIDRATHFRWMDRGSDGDEPYCDYCDAVTRARDVWEAKVCAELSESATYTKSGEKVIVGQNRQFLLKHLRREAFNEDFKAKMREDAINWLLDTVRQREDQEFYQRLLGCIFPEDSEAAA